MCAWQGEICRRHHFPITGRILKGWRNAMTGSTNHAGCIVIHVGSRPPLREIQRIGMAGITGSATRSRDVIGE